MKVFACKRSGGYYSRGVILVAANTVQEAFNIVARDPYFEWMFEWIDNNGDISYEGADDAKLVNIYYPIDEWYEISVLNADVKEPMILVEEGHTE